MKFIADYIIYMSYTHALIGGRLGLIGNGIQGTTAMSILLIWYSALIHVKQENSVTDSVYVQSTEARPDNNIDTFIIKILDQYVLSCNYNCILFCQSTKGESQIDPFEFNNKF